jgi:hypothetical protein
MKFLNQKSELEVSLMDKGKSVNLYQKGWNGHFIQKPKSMKKCNQDMNQSWKTIRLVTPVDKVENIDFYTKKCGFRLDGSELDGNVRVVRFLKER